MIGEGEWPLMLARGLSAFASCGPWQACLFSVDFSLDALGWAHCTSTIASDVHAASVVCSTIER